MMYNNVLKKLREQKFINDNNKVSPWLERKISDILRNEILELTNFIKTEVTLSDRIQTMLLGITEQPLCLTCQTPTNYFRSYRNYAKYCCVECDQKSTERSENMSRLEKEGKLSIGKNGVEIQREKHNGLLAIQADKTIIERVKETCLERYGVDNGSKTPEAREKISKATKGKSKTFSGQKPQHSKLSEDQKFLLNNLDVLYDKFIQSNVSVTRFSTGLGFGRTTVGNILNRNGYFIPIIQNGINTSNPEKEICEFLDSYGIEYIPQFRIGRKKIDIFIPAIKLCIEYHGLMYHSFGKSKYSKFNNHLEEDRNIHLNRLLLCEENGFELMQIFENEWTNLSKKEIIKSILLSKLNLNKKVFARKCIVKEIDAKTSATFLDCNHLQGNCNATHKIGLFYQDELVSLMTFSPPRFNSDYDFELIRFANKKGISVIGGASKLYSYFVQKYNAEKIISYCDRRMFSGNLYENIGFEFSHITKPNYFYFLKKDYKFLTRYQCQKHKLKTVLSEFDSNKSEKENMFDNGYRRVWDCGNKVYVWEKK